MNHNSCRSRSCRTWSQTACPPGTSCICCTGSTPRASAYLCRKDPERCSKSIKVSPTRQGSSRTNLGVDPDDLAALLAVVRKHILVALDAVGMVVTQHIPLSGQAVVALPATEVVVVPVLVHGFRVFAAEN